MSEIDDILNDLDLVESETRTEPDLELVDPNESKNKPVEEIPEVDIPEETESSTTSDLPEVDSDTEILADDQRDVEKQINTDPVYDEDSPEYMMSKETMETFLEFGTRYLNLMLERKKIGEDVKALKQEFAEQGVSVNAAIKVLNSINSDHRKSQTELFELEKLREIFSKSKQIMDRISELSSKD